MNNLKNNHKLFSDVMLLFNYLFYAWCKMFGMASVEKVYSFKKTAKALQLETLESDGGNLDDSVL